MGLFSRFSRRGGKGQPSVNHARPSVTAGPSRPSSTVVPNEPIRAPATQVPPVTVSKADSGGLPIWVLGVVVAVVLILVMCVGFFLLSEPTPQEVVVVVQPTTVIKAGQTPVTKVNQTPIPPASNTTSQPEEEGGGFPWGFFIIVFVIVAIGGFLLFAGFPPESPLMNVRAGEQVFVTNYWGKNVTAIAGPTWYLVKRLIERVSSSFPVGAIAGKVPTRRVWMKPPQIIKEGIKIRGSIEVKFDVDYQYRIPDVPTFVEKCEGSLEKLAGFLQDIIIALMEQLPHNYVYGEEWQALEEAIREVAERKFQTYGANIINLQISNMDIIDERVKKAMAQGLVEATDAQAQMTTAKIEGRAEKQKMKAMGMTPEQYTMFVAVQQGGPVLGLLMQMFQNAVGGKPSPALSLPVANTGVASKSNGKGEEENLEDVEDGDDDDVEEEDEE